MNFSTIRPRHWILAFGAIAIAVSLGALLGKKSPVLSLVNKRPDVLITTGTVTAGDTLSSIVTRHAIKPEYVPKIQVAFSKVYNLRRIKPGHTYQIVTSTDHVFREFLYQESPIHAFLVSRSSAGVYEAVEDRKKTVWVEKRVVGEVKTNMYRDLLSQGYSESFVANLVGDLADNIFGWKIDFFTEQRPGDTFTVLMEQEFLEGSTDPLWGGRGRILAATYIGKATRQKDNVAIRYRQPGTQRDEYYDLKGDAVRRAFLRAPFTHGAFRVSSGYNPKRFHPILRTYRPHHGTDYAGGYGTPVASVGKGTVIFAGRKGGYGKCVEVRHNSKYVSRYGHLSRIAVRPGASIHQGQYIGNIGSTGLSTGPHLHFEMLVDGRQRNFLTMSFPSAASVPSQYLSDFQSVRDGLMARLNDGTLAKSSPVASQQATH